MTTFPSPQDPGPPGSCLDERGLRGACCWGNQGPGPGPEEQVLQDFCVPSPHSRVQNPSTSRHGWKGMEQTLG